MMTVVRRLIAGGLVVCWACLAADAGAGIAMASGPALTITAGACSGGGTSYCFSPEQAQATSGDTATWTNRSGVSHTVTSCTSSDCPGAVANTGGQTFSASAPGGGSGSVTFTQAGTYTYYCMIHGYAAMHGTITVAAAATQAPATQAPTVAGPRSSPTPSAGAGLDGVGAGVALMALGGLLLWRRRHAVSAP